MDACVHEWMDGQTVEWVNERIQHMYVSSYEEIMKVEKWGRKKEGKGPLLSKEDRNTYTHMHIFSFCEK